MQLLALLGIGVLLFPLAAPARAQAARQKQVLVLYSTNRDSQISIVGDQDLQTMLREGLPEGVDYYSEHLDEARFSEGAQQNAVREFLRFKYAKKRLDVVIAMSDVAAAFLHENRHLWPRSPVVFFASTRAPLPISNATGIVAPLDLSKTVTLALTLQPDVRHVFVVTGALDSERVFEDLARTQLARFTDRVNVTYATGLPTTELLARLRSLPKHSIVYYLVAGQDGAGEKFHPLRYLDTVSAAARVPTYSWVDSAIGHGVVGGSLKSQPAEVAAIGRLALRVLRGERADRIPIARMNLQVQSVDWRQIQRWGISKARVPVTTAVHFRDPGVWMRYKPYAVATTSVLLIQGALIASLLVLRSRRLRTERELTASQTQLRASYERVRHLSRRLLMAQEAERARIARDLHDDIGQQLALVSLDLQLASNSSEAPAPRSDATANALTQLEQISRAVHNLSHRLHPAKLQLLGLVAGLKELQREFSRPDLAVTFVNNAVPNTLPEDVSVCMYRVAQEALQNVSKHSGARHASMQLTAAGPSLTLKIVDDGKGFEASTVPSTGLGLISMRERLEALRGTLTVCGHQGGGTCVEAAVEIPTATAAPSIPSGSAVDPWLVSA